MLTQILPQLSFGRISNISVLFLQIESYKCKYVKNLKIKHEKLKSEKEMCHTSLYIMVKIEYWSLNKTKT